MLLSFWIVSGNLLRSCAHSVLYILFVLTSDSVYPVRPYSSEIKITWGYEVHMTTIHLFNSHFINDYQAPGTLTEE